MATIFSIEYNYFYRKKNSSLTFPNVPESPADDFSSSTFSSPISPMYNWGPYFSNTEGAWKALNCFVASVPETFNTTFFPPNKIYD